MYFKIIFSMNIINEILEHKHMMREENYNQRLDSSISQFHQMKNSNFIQRNLKRSELISNHQEPKL